MDAIPLTNSQKTRYILNKIGFVSPVRRNEAPDRCTAASNVI